VASAETGCDLKGKKKYKIGTLKILIYRLNQVCHIISALELLVTKYLLAILKFQQQILYFILYNIIDYCYQISFGS